MRAARGRASAEQARRMIMWAGIAALLLLPLLAMQFTKEVTWTPADFASAAVLLGGAGVIYEVAAWRTRDPLRRKIIGAAIIAVVAIIWAQGAVGIF